MYLSRYPNTKVYIQGHADRLEYKNNRYQNVALSKKRSENVLKACTESGIDTEKLINGEPQFVTDWFSKYLNREYRQGTPVEHDSGGVSDRRVEIRVIRQYKKGEFIPDEIVKYTARKLVNSVYSLSNKKKSNAKYNIFLKDANIELRGLGISQDLLKQSV